MPATGSHVLAKRYECARGSWSSSAWAATYLAGTDKEVNLCACRITAATVGLDDSTSRSVIAGYGNSF